MPRKKTTTIESTQGIDITQKKDTKKVRRSNGEGTVIERKDGRFEVQMSLPDGERKSVYGKNRKEALTKAREIRRQIENNIYVEPSREMAAEHFEQWLAVKRLDIKVGPYATYRYIVYKYLIPAFDGMRLQQVTLKHVQSLYIQLQEAGLAPSTIRGIHNVLKMALNDAVKNGKIAVDPAVGATLPRNEKKEMRYLSTEEIAFLLELSETQKHGMLLTVALTTGMRKGELLALKWDDVDLAKGIIQVRRSLTYRNVDGTGYQYLDDTPKTRYGRRMIHIPEFVTMLLKQHRVQQRATQLATPDWEDNQLVFPNKYGRYICPSTINSAYKRLLQKEGIKDAKFHATRHGHATDLLEQGENIRVVQERLGHSDVSITLGVYGHVTPTMQQQTVERLNARYGKKRRGVEKKGTGKQKRHA